MTPGRGLPEELERLLQSLPARWKRERGRTVIDVILGDHLIHGLEIALVDLLVKPTYQGLVLLCRHRASSFLSRWWPGRALLLHFPRPLSGANLCDALP